MRNNNNQAPLSVEDMHNVTSAFNAAYEQMLGRYKGSHDEAALGEYIGSITHLTRPQMFFYSPELGQFAKDMFRIDYRRDFILGLTYNWLSRWSEARHKYDELAASLAFAISADTGDSSMWPSDYASRLEDEGSIEQLLKENKWICTVLLLMTHGNAP